jgi:SAM-dependent methyltransferase
VIVSTEEAFALARAMRADRSPRSWAVGAYWRGCAALTGLVEQWSGRHEPEGRTTLNFGCGNVFMNDAVNADLCAPHRFLFGKRRPDLYWSGRTRLPAYERHFSLVVCEHVIEHMLPDDAFSLLSSFYDVLMPGGVIVISFPDLRTILDGASSSTAAARLVELNAVIYRHGHRFMYSAEFAATLLSLVGFREIRSGARSLMPCPERLLESRESQSAYVTARRPVVG